MTQETLNKQKFESLVKEIASLDFEYKQQLWVILDQEMEDEEEKQEVLEAKKAYQKGDYVTLEEYNNQRKTEENN